MYVDICPHGNLPKVQEVFWTKNGEKLDIKGSGGRYTEVGLNNPSLTIFGVNEYDAGSYQLIAFNDVGANKSDVIVLGNFLSSMSKISFSLKNWISKY